MSQENVELVQGFFDAWNAGDMSALKPFFAADAVARPPEDWPESGLVVGGDEIVRQLTANREAFDADIIEPVGPFVAVADRVVVRYVWRASGRGPGVRIELTLVITIRKGKMIAIEYFWDHTEALEIVGLSE